MSKKENKEVNDEEKVATDAAKKEDKPKKKKKLSKTEQLTEDNTELKQQVGELKDKYLRLYAEFENYKKRTMKDKLDLMKTAAQDTLSVMLPVLRK